MRALLIAALTLGAMLAGATGLAFAHDGKMHATLSGAASQLPAGALPFPIDIDLDFDLIDQHGARRTEADFDETPLAIFFGYANCQSICPVALSALASAVDQAHAVGITVQPIMITIDPARDTPEKLSRILPDIHPHLVGLTGDEAQLAATRAAFQIGAKLVSRDVEGAPVYAHGSFIYLFDGDGALVSVMPPVLGTQQIAEIMKSRLGGGKPGL